jgi:hypothetical protein
MPAVLVTEPDSQLARRASALQTNSVVPPPPASPTRATPDSALTANERRNRHCSSVEVRRRPQRCHGHPTDLV